MAEAFTGTTATTATTVTAATETAAAATAGATDALKGWAALRQAVNKTLPGLLDQAESVGASTDRLLSTGLR
jgi:hypothetical protein